MMGTHGVKVKTNDYGRARWLTPSGGLTTKLMHAGLATPERAAEAAENLVRDNPGEVEWARAEAVMS